MSLPAAPARSTPKTAHKSRIVTLRLPAGQLSRFPDTAASTPIKPDPSPSAQPPELADAASDSNATPIPPVADSKTPAAPPKSDSKKRKGADGIPAKKRAPPSIDPMKERNRPGPKKKPRLPDGTIDRTADFGVVVKPGAAPVPAHKLGPKANTGAINAGLRALDRSGKPCRKWQKNGIRIKSFTGNLWGVDTWKAPKRDESFSGDVKSDSTGSSELKPNASSVIASERSHSHVDGADTIMTHGIESSPAPALAA